MKRGAARDTGPTPRTRQKVRERANWCCEKCGRSAMGGDIHHRKPRRMGGTSDPSINLFPNLVLLCRDCHRDIESNRHLAAASGWLVAAQFDPALIPIRTNSFGLVYLTGDGSYRLPGAHDERDAHERDDEGADADVPGSTQERP